MLPKIYLSLNMIITFGLLVKWKEMNFPNNLIFSECLFTHGICRKYGHNAISLFHRDVQIMYIFSFIWISRRPNCILFLAGIPTDCMDIKYLKSKSVNKPRPCSGGTSHGTLYCFISVLTSCLICMFSICLYMTMVKNTWWPKHFLYRHISKLV